MFFCVSGLLLANSKTFSQSITVSFPFIKLKPGQLITGTKLSFDEKIFGASTVTLDGKEFKSRQISIFRSDATMEFINAAYKKRTSANDFLIYSGRRFGNDIRRNIYQAISFGKLFTIFDFRWAYWRLDLFE